MTMGQVAKLTVKDPKSLNNEVLHRVPHAMMVQILRLDMQLLKETQSDGR